MLVLIRLRGSLKMNIIIIGILSALTIAVVFSIGNNAVYAQQQNMTQIIQEKFATSVSLIYESPNTAVLQGDLIISSGLLSNQNSTSNYEGGLAANTDLWAAMDLLRNNGFKTQQIITTGQGSVGNPHTVYIVMTK